MLLRFPSVNFCCIFISFLEMYALLLRCELPSQGLSIAFSFTILIMLSADPKHFSCISYGKIEWFWPHPLKEQLGCVGISFSFLPPNDNPDNPQDEHPVAKIESQPPVSINSNIPSSVYLLSVDKELHSFD